MCECLARGSDRSDGCTGVVEYFLQQLARIRVIVDDEDLDAGKRRHVAHLVRSH